eukprot:2079152-Rhodomonas_salina.1
MTVRRFIDRTGLSQIQRRREHDVSLPVAQTPPQQAVSNPSINTHGYHGRTPPKKKPTSHRRNTKQHITHGRDTDIILDASRNLSSSAGFPITLQRLAICATSSSSLRIERITDPSKISVGGLVMMSTNLTPLHHLSPPSASASRIAAGD